MGMYADLFKEESGVFRRSYNGNQVIVLKGERTGRNINISAPLYAADQDVAAVFLNYLHNRHSMEPEFRQQLKFQQFYPAFGKCIQFNG